MNHVTDELDTGRRRRMLATTMAVTAIVAIVTVVVGPWRQGGTMTDPSSPGRPDQVVRPPDVDTSQAHVIVSPSSVPVGTDVVLILANPTDEDRSFGVAGSFQRWNGAAWTDYRQLTTSTGTDAGAGRLYGLDEPVMVPMIAFTAPAHAFAQPVRTHLDGIDPGWYRVGLGGATGLVEVGGASGRTLPVSDTAVTFAGTKVVRAGQDGTLDLDSRARDPRAVNDFDRAEQVGSYTTGSRVERYDDGRWVVVPSDTVVTVDGDAVGGPFRVSLPALDPGVYRLSRDASQAGRIDTLFWALPLAS